MTYSVKEVFYSLQGEGAQTGKPAIFLRFAGCNLWSGQEKDRVSAICRFCDTDFVGVNGSGGGKFKTAQDLTKHLLSYWPQTKNTPPYIICTGGEPLLQLDKNLIEALHQAGCIIAVETNGTLAAPAGIDWICVSPKGNAPLKQKSGHELKLPFPQEEAQATPDCFTELDFQHFFLQPIDNAHYHENLRQAVDYCLTHPEWRLSLQTHKIIGIE